MLPTTKINVFLPANIRRKKAYIQTLPAQVSKVGLTPFELMERRLMDRIGNGDSEAFWELWLVHQPAIFRICLSRLGGSRADAEDISSKLMQRAQNVLPQAAPAIINLEAWLIRMAINLCLDLQRLDKRRWQGAWAIQTDNLDIHSGALAINDRFRPDRDFVNRELGRSIVTAIRSLPPLLSESASLFFLKDRSYSEISETLHTSNANIRKRIQAARILLKKALAK